MGNKQNTPKKQEDETAEAETHAKFFNKNIQKLIDNPNIQTTLEVIIDFQGWFCDTVKDSENWMCVTNDALRIELAQILVDYRDVLEDTHNIASEIIILCSDWGLELQKLSEACKAAKKGETKRMQQLLAAFEAVVFTQTVSVTSINNVIQKYSDLINRVGVATKNINADIAETRSRRRLFIGLAVASGIVFAGCILMTILSAGALSPVAIGVGVAVATATDTAVTATSSLALVGVISGAIGSTAFGVNLGVSLGVQASLKKMENTLSSLHDNYTKMIEQMTVTRNQLTFLSPELMQQQKTGQQLDKLAKLMMEIEDEKLQNAIQDNNKLEKTARRLKNDVEEKHNHYCDKLVAITVDLVYKG